jgi:recombination protein RecA
LKNDIKARAAKEAARLSAKHGNRTGALASTQFRKRTVPTGVLALDYALGTGGWETGHPAMIYGPRDVGKSSVLGLSAIREAQKLDMTTGIIAVEPGIDDKWLIKNGVDPELVVVARPDDGEIAFQILREWCEGDIVDFMLFDSIGAILRQSESGPDGKPNTGGASSLITWGVKNILQPCWKREKGVIFINQQRQDMNSRIPGQYSPPGGEAIQHANDTIIYLRPGRERFTVKEDDGSGKKFDLVVGQQLVAQIKRNKLSEGTGNKAVFNYYSAESELHAVGIDVGEDIINTGIRTGVIEKAGAYLRHPSFPKKGDSNQIQGRESAKEFIVANPEVAEVIRKDVLEVMRKEVDGNAG